jgi:putative tryptophan/tyrosine transport system substrate-binding protein
MLKPVCCYPPPSYFSLRSKSASLRSPNGFPSFPRSGDFPKAGGFIAYGTNLGDIRRRCGDCVAKILHGAKPSDLPIQRPERFDPVINLKTAEALDISVPPMLIVTADEVIE